MNAYDLTKGWAGARSPKRVLRVVHVPKSAYEPARIAWVTVYPKGVKPPAKVVRP